MLAVVGAELRGLLDAAAAECSPWNPADFFRTWGEEIWAFSSVLCGQIASRTVVKYPWIDKEDLSGDMLLKTEHFARVYDPTRSSCFSKHLFWKFNFYVKDVLRREDPLGVRYPQRERYPTWFRLGEQSGRLGSNEGPQEGENQSPFGADFDGSSLADPDSSELDFIFDDDCDWHQQVERLAEMAADNRQVNRLPSMIDCGLGVCRSANDKLWDTRKKRVKLKKRGSTLRDWIRSNRLLKRTAEKNHRKNRKMNPLTQSSAESDTQEQSPLMMALESAGLPGANVAALVKRSGMTKNAVQAAILRLRRAGSVYVVGYHGGARKLEFYALAKLFPEGPPIQQVFRTRTKPKPITKKTQASNKLPKLTARPKEPLDKSDLMLVVTALAGVKNAELKSKLLAVLTESMNA